MRPDEDPEYGFDRELEKRSRRVGGPGKGRKTEETDAPQRLSLEAGVSDDFAEDIFRGGGIGEANFSSP